MRGAIPGLGLAVIRLDALERVAAEEILRAGEATLRPSKPYWANF
jgi:hypothetical protein